MDFLKILRSFEEFIFEAATWLVFYPLTLWRIVTRPLATMRYSDREQGEPDERRYDDAISPPLLLLFTLLLINLVAMALHVAPPEGASTLMKLIVSSPQNLALFRSLVFSLLPLVAAVALLVAQRTKLSRESLRPPFYAQCYLAAPVAAVINGGALIYQRNEVHDAWGWGLMGLAAIWFMVTQARWFADKLKVSRRRGLAVASLVVVISVIYLLVICVPLALL